jgi:putative two-component system response regulator
LTARRRSVLVVDDTAANLVLAQAYLADVDCNVVVAESGPAALSIVRQAEVDLVLLDVNMPGMDGFEVCRQIRCDPAVRLLPIVMLTAMDRVQDRVLALEAGADDFLAKPVDRIELVARVRSALRLKAVYDSLESAEQVIFALATAVEAKDSYTQAHTERVAFAAREVGIRLRLPEADLEALYRGGIVHDIGKIGVPDTILQKPGPLDPDETESMQQHPIIGERIVMPLRSAAGVLPIVRHHHEHYDGTGYPDRLAGEDIPRLARIVSVCDAFDALVSDRPYRPGMSPERAITILKAGAGTQWDPTIVELLTSDLPALGLTADRAGSHADSDPRRIRGIGSEVA